MHIGIDIRLIGKNRTGDEAVFFGLVKNLAMIDQKNYYTLFTDETEPKKIKFLRSHLGLKKKENFEIVSLRAKNKFIWNFWSISRYLQKNELDIYLTQYVIPFFVPRKTKIITIIHDISFNFFPQMIKLKDLFFLKILIPLSIKRARKIVAVSRFTKNEIINYYGIEKNKVSYIHNAVADDFLRQNVSSEKIDAVKKKYQLGENYILYIGTLQPRKNIPLLIQAFYLLEKSLQEKVNLVIAGNKKYNFDSKIDIALKKSSVQEKIIFPGFIDEKDKALVMAGAKIFCFPSFYEGFGIPILEAMSLGIPVVASEISPHREIAGIAVKFFNLQEAADLAEKLTLLLKNKKIQEELSRKGLEQSKNFSWQKTAQKMLDIFQSV
ncbi:MAG: hypothetical protein COZ85_01775 [Candidatus Moranbacteria bacterium CG_4_8_14_3_um_filter_34_16]|nr:MAG: hypothetical protein COT31_04195 [Candidatus Moranbacteria bacterium CG08_land_8_20_14_0_20_34_16]PIW95084.1 MAG: hypothetical protein COZ85_01775 [Candidatus Moranbacteria bacterium CG_4_8_14_3_um_filter_34_16]PJA89485.1 MAG: hypothetical protein CO138_00195 [Candidatus Moranbacteria bacterium CG_4_9_14_3_um_filter_33_15]